MNVKSAFTLGVLVFLGLAFLGYFAGSSAIRIKEYERSVTVKGLAENEYPADVVLWPIKFSATANELTKLYELIEEDANKISAFLKANGIEEQELTESPPTIVDRVAQGYEKAKIESRYTASQVLTVYSEKIDLVRSIMKKLEELGKSGVALISNGYENPTEYLFRRLNEIKPGMVEEATINARKVAEKFAQDSNSQLGKIKSARQGQFSIAGRDNNNPHIKRIRVVSTIEYYLSD